MFSSDVAQQIGAYVYRLIDPRNGETFYIGKGRNTRVFSHAQGDLSAEDDKISEKLKRIREIQTAGFEVQHVIHRHGLDDETAFEVEAALIDAFPGLTNIADGHGNSDRGTAHARELVERYSAEEATFDEPLIEILVPHSGQERTIYDATRFAWRLSPTRAGKAQYALAVRNGLIVDVFEVVEWLPATPENFPSLATEALPNRYGFVGQQAGKSALDKYLRKKVPPRPRGAANPIRYHNIN